MRILVFDKRRDTKKNKRISNPFHQQNGLKQTTQSVQGCLWRKKDFEILTSFTNCRKRVAMAKGSIKFFCDRDRVPETFRKSTEPKCDMCLYPLALKSDWTIDHAITRVYPLLTASTKTLFVSNSDNVLSFFYSMDLKPTLEIKFLLKPDCCQIRFNKRRANWKIARVNDV